MRTVDISEAFNVHSCTRCRFVVVCCSSSRSTDFE